MKIQRTYTPDQIYTAKELFEYIHKMELTKLVPLKSKLKYDTDMTHEEKVKLTRDIFSTQHIYDQLAAQLNLRLTQPLFNL